MCQRDWQHDCNSSDGDYGQDHNFDPDDYEDENFEDNDIDEDASYLRNCIFWATSSPMPADRNSHGFIYDAGSSNDIIPDRCAYILLVLLGFTIHAYKNIFIFTRAIKQIRQFDAHSGEG